MNDNNNQVKIHKHKKRAKQFFKDRIAIIPSLVTSISICLGMHSIYLIHLNRIEHAFICICISAFVDGIDGRIARYLNSASEFGKTIDSLADFLSFSIAPALIIYFYKLQNWISMGWSCCIFFVLCMAFRLARFSSEHADKESFTGIPAPAAGLLVFTPFALEKTLQTNLHPLFFALSLLLIAFGMIGKFRTIALNRMKLKINKGSAHVFFALFAFAAVFAITYVWLTYLILGTLYLIHVVISALKYDKVY